MEQLFDLKTYEDYLESGRTWVVDNAVTLGISGVAQLVVVGLAFLAARLVAARVQGLLERVAKGWRYEQQLRRIAAALEPLTLAVLLWLATMAGRLLERRITTLPNLTPSLQVLLSQLLKIVFVIIAVVVALNSVGIDLTAFAVFTGALGVGIGFGLQKPISNFVSGIMLLLDKSVKPGDVIAVGDTYGWVGSLGARYVAVVTRDGTEYLIPN